MSCSAAWAGNGMVAFCGAPCIAIISANMAGSSSIGPTPGGGPPAPIISGGIGGGPPSDDTTGTDFGELFEDLPFGRPNNYIATFQLNQLLWAGGSVGAARRVATLFRSAARNQLDEVEADLTLRRKEITGPNLALMLIKYPLMTVKVIGAIYWQALKLWVKGARFYTHPVKRT